MLNSHRSGIGLVAIVMQIAVAALAAMTGHNSAATPKADVMVHEVLAVTGSTYVSGMDATFPVGPGTMTEDVDLTTGTFTGALLFPGTNTVHFSLYGISPATATAQFIPVGQTTGTVGPTWAHVDAKILIHLVSFYIDGIQVLPPNSTCQTGSTVDIPLVSQPGFTPQTGGTFKATFSVPDFVGCGSDTDIINAVATGGGNIATVTTAHTG
jgi:hypothetical protein